MKEKIYISGAITGVEDAAPLLFGKAEEMLIGKGFEVVNPMTLTHEHDLSWLNYMRVDIKALVDCEYIYMLPNWEQSRGAKIEHNLAKELGLVIIYEKA